MLFNSIEYLIYLPIVFLLYWLVFGKRLRLQNLFVVVVSYLFYGWWDYRFLALIALTSFCSWLSGIGIEEVRVRAGKIPRWFDKGIVVANVIFNLLILSFFKYYDFFVDSLVDAFSYIGISLHISTLSLLLPVGNNLPVLEPAGSSKYISMREPVPGTPLMTSSPCTIA